jgi:phosphopantothenoylcysteine decarboxylase/phosphopantothenate--cysteine ligase
MGYALASAAAARGAEVTLVSGPAGLPDPPGLRTVRVESAAQMREAVLAAWKEAHAGIMAAAVADYRPARAIEGKQKKKDGPLTLKLERTADILAEMGKEKGGRLLVGFAAETEDLEKNARDKLRRKGLDLIAANLVAGEQDAMGADRAAVLLIGADGREEILPSQRKEAVAAAVLDRLAEMWKAKQGRK